MHHRTEFTNTKHRRWGTLEAAAFGVRLGKVPSETSFPRVGFPSLTVGAMVKCVLDKRGYGASQP